MMRDPEKEYENAQDVMMELKARDEDMTTEEAAEVLRNAAWLGTNADREQIEEAVEMAIKALTAQEKAQEVSNDSPELDNNIGDLISRQAAIVSVLKGRLSEDDSLVESVEECNSIIEWAADVLKNLPSAQPDSKETSSTHKALDTISRHDAIDALEKVAELYPWRVPGDRDSYSQYNEAWQDALNRADGEIEALPSAQSKIIRCKNCKHKGTKNCVANAWTTIFGVMVKDDFYCGLAERRTDGV